MNIINTVKFIGAALVAAGGAITAYLLNARAKTALARTEGLIGFLRYARRQIDCYAMPAARIFEGCEEELLANCGYFAASRPQSVKEFIVGCSSVDEEAFKIMKGFADGFGKGYRAEQLKLCDACIEELTALRAEAHEKLPLRKKLNSTLCLSSAATIVILLI